MNKAFIKTLCGIGLLIAVTIITSTAYSAALEGRKTIRLVEASGDKHTIGEVEFIKHSDETLFKVTWKKDAFSDHFLSMRPFKCLEGEAKNWYQIPYPYELKRSVSENDLTDLEYALMFIWKEATEYGINMWNGVYYQLEINNGKINGVLNEMDMEKIASPPENGNLRPISQKDLEVGDPDSHWLPFIVIE